MPPVEWMLRLNDLVSGPAVAMNRQIQGVNSALAALGVQSRATRLGPVADGLKYATDQLRYQRAQLMLNKTSLGEHGGALDSLVPKIDNNRRAVRDWLLILDPLVRAFSAVSRAAFSMGRDIAQAIGTREGALLGLKANLGNSAGVKFYDDLARAAARYGKTVADVVGLGRNLVENGATPRAATALTAAISDIQVRNPGRAGQFQTGVENMLGGDVLSTKMFRAMTQGVSGLARIYRQQLRSEYGITGTLGDVDKAMGENRFSDPNKNTAALLNSVRGLRGQGGQLGTMASQFGSNTLEGLLQRIRSTSENAFASLERSAGFKSLKDVLRNFADVLGEGKTKGMLAGLANNLGAMLKPLTGPEGKKNMEAFFDSMKKGIESALPGLASIARAIGVFAKWGILKPLEGLGIVTGASDQGKALLALTRGTDTINTDPSAALTPEARARVARTNAAQATNRLFDGLVGNRPAAGRQPVMITFGDIVINTKGKGDSRDIAKAVRDTMTTELVNALDGISVGGGSQ